MKKRKKTGNIFLAIAFAAILAVGCASGDMAADNTDIKEDAVIGDAGNVADTLGTLEDSASGEGEESIGSAAGETENTEFQYDMDGDFIVNYKEVFAENEIFGDQDMILDVPLEIPECIDREEDIVGEFCEGFPEELQQLLVYYNDSIHRTLPEESALAQLYHADFEKVTDYDRSELPTDLIEIDTMGDRMIAVDVDSDGEDEYININNLWDAVGRERAVVMEYDGEHGWDVIGYGTAPYAAAYTGVFDYEGTKYIINGNLLVCWNDGYGDAASDDSEKPWNVMAANRELAGYTVNEIYSREGDDRDYLARVDLENPRNNAERDYSEEAYYLTAWDCGEWLMRLDCDWEEEYDGKTYLYVASNFNTMGWPQYDLLITIFEEGEDCMEAVKVYYFAAHYRLSLEREECGADGPWYTMEGDENPSH